MIDVDTTSNLTTREKIEAWIESIPRGKARMLTDGMEEVGGVRKTWQNVSGKRMIKRVVSGRPTCLLVSHETASKMKSDPDES